MGKKLRELLPRPPVDLAASGQARSETLWLQVVSGANLPPADHNGRSDPFCRVTLKGGPSAKGSKRNQTDSTRHENVTLYPVWGKEIQVGSQARCLPPCLSSQAHLFPSLAWQQFDLGKALSGGHNLGVVVEIEVVDWDRYSSNDALGRVEIDLGQVLPEPDELKDKWFELHESPTSSRRPSGAVRVRMLRTPNLPAFRT